MGAVEGGTTDEAGVCERDRVGLLASCDLPRVEISPGDRGTGRREGGASFLLRPGPSSGPQETRSSREPALRAGRGLASTSRFLRKEDIRSGRQPLRSNGPLPKLHPETFGRERVAHLLAELRPPAGVQLARARLRSVRRSMPPRVWSLPFLDSRCTADKAASAFAKQPPRARGRLTFSRKTPPAFCERRRGSRSERKRGPSLRAPCPPVAL